jgi:hypothetical protein
LALHAIAAAGAMSGTLAADALERYDVVRDLPQPMHQGVSATSRPHLAIVFVDRGRRMPAVRGPARSDVFVVGMVNAGDVSTGAGTAVIVFDDRNASGAFEERVDHLLGEHVVSEALSPGATATLLVSSNELPADWRKARVSAVTRAAPSLEQGEAAGKASLCNCQESSYFVNDFDGEAFSALAPQPNQTGQNTRWRETNGYLEADGGGGVTMAEMTADDFSVEVKVQFPNGATNDAGVVFGLRGAYNWHQLRVDGRRARLMSFVRGERMVTHVSSEIALRPGWWYTLKAEVRAGGVEGYIDGFKVLTHRGRLATRGAIGVMQDEVRVRYDDLVISPLSAAKPSQ